MIRKSFVVLPLMTMKIYPSLIAADVLNLEKVVRDLEPHCAGFHLDVMDFHFVDNLTFGPLFINALRTITTKQLWIHLMVDEPHKYFNLMKLNHGDIVSVHIENLKDPKILADSQERGWHTSLALNPATPVSEAAPFLPQINQLLLMSVNPGFSGQEFMPQTFNKIDELQQIRQNSNLNFSIGIDGGINKNNITDLYHAGAEEFVMGNALFGQKNPREVLKEFMGNNYT
jgi:ribulose-phosphate 3-epimerase